MGSRRYEGGMCRVRARVRARAWGCGWSVVGWYGLDVYSERTGVVEVGKMRQRTGRRRRSGRRRGKWDGEGASSGSGPRAGGRGRG